MIETMVLPDADSVGAHAADILDAAARSGSGALGLATGSSTDPIYSELVRRHGGRENPYRRMQFYLLDEYVGLPLGHPERYAEVIRRSFADPLGIPFSRVRAPDVDASDADRAAAAFEQEITDAGGIEVQLLGVGGNGHIAFNEPGTPFESRTRVVELAARTRQDNARFFGGEVASVPRRAMSQGIATILGARRIVLVATGRAKAEAVAALLRTRPTPLLPVSALQVHPEVTMLLDRDAASGIDADQVAVEQTRAASCA